MKLPKGRCGRLAGLTIIGVLGLTALTYGLARLDQLPKGQEVVVQGNDPIAKQSSVIGVESQIGETNQEQEKSAEQNSKLSVQDFPSPVQVEPIRGLGNYFSENLNAYLFHAGRDFPLSEGAVIRATHGGKVTFAGADPILGQKVEIDCGENWHVVYGGLDNLRVQQGEVIKNNAILGQIGYYSGADGINDRTQLHYEVWNADQAQVP